MILHHCEVIIIDEGLVAVPREEPVRREVAEVHLRHQLDRRGRLVDDELQVERRLPIRNPLSLGSALLTRGVGAADELGLPWRRLTREQPLEPERLEPRAVRDEGAREHRGRPAVVAADARVGRVALLGHVGVCVEGGVRKEVPRDRHLHRIRPLRLRRVVAQVALVPDERLGAVEADEARRVGEVDAELEGVAFLERALKVARTTRHRRRSAHRRRRSSASPAEHHARQVFCCLPLGFYE